MSTRSRPRQKSYGKDAEEKVAIFRLALKVTLENFDTTETSLRKSRRHSVVTVRHMLAYFLWDMGFTEKEISACLAKDRTTIHHGLGRHEDLYETDPGYVFQYDLLVKAIEEELCSSNQMSL